MSVPIEVPKDIHVKALGKLLDMSFKDMLKSIIKGPCRHITIEDGLKFELCPVSVEAYGEKLCKFTFAITHECEDDRTHWVKDKLISIGVGFSGDSLVLEGI